MSKGSDSLTTCTLLRLWVTGKLRPIVQWAFIACELTAFLVAVVPLIPAIPPFLSDTVSLRIAVACASFGVLIVTLFNKLDDDRMFGTTQLLQLKIANEVLAKEIVIARYPELLQDKVRKSLESDGEESSTSSTDLAHPQN